MPIKCFTQSVSGVSFDTNLPFDLMDKQDNRGVLQGKQRLGWGYRLNISNFKLLMGVIFAHGLLLYLLVFLWRSQQGELGLSLAERAPKVSALKAYFIYAPSTQSKLDDRETPSTKAPTQAVTIQPDNASQGKLVESVVMQSKPTPKTVSKAELKPESEPVLKAEPKPESKSVTSTKSEALQVPNTDKTAVKSVSTAKASTQSTQSQTLESSEGATSTKEIGAQGLAPSASVGLFTQQYFERQREQALDDLVIEQADKFTRKSNMSEMSPEMELLFVPNADDFSGPTSLDLALDPNRIVRKGDTCYRVVQVGTQVNPYAENLGFPFDCSGKKINQAIDDAIQSRLNKMMLKPHK
ncbi:hypothetical protein [Shewanella putrefaciens]|uniref:hypothetical protein n=1 Tax=Shewanella putrefaciens TaxID=24 RepID=UPI0018E903CA|nr:hypothetical protein [Shewanella putrefaciens]